MGTATLAQHVLSRLVRKLGGARSTARKLDIPDHLLEAYLAGKRTIPERIWLQAVDILMGDLTDVRRPGPDEKEDPKGTR